MKTVRMIVGLLVMSLSFMACEKDANEHEEAKTIIGEWKLTALVNISDQHKYLDRILEFDNHVYRSKEADGELRAESKWSLDAEEETLILHNGIFGNDEAIEYRIMELTDTSLKLERHYTLDNKNAYLEYHFSRVE